MTNFSLTLNTYNKEEQENDIVQIISILIILLWIFTPLQKLLPRLAAIPVGVHGWNGMEWNEIEWNEMASDYRFFNLTVNPSDDYGLFL
jgi:hypothetical protein